MVKTPTLLIADDETELRELLAEEAKSLGFQVIEAGSGREALERIRRAPKDAECLDAVLADINMPELNGLELLRQVRSEGFETPFVLITAYGDKEMAVSALRLGAIDFLEKPYDRDHLRRVLTHAVGLGVLIRDLEEEVDQYFRDSGMPESQRERARAAIREVLKLRKQAEIARSGQENNRRPA